MRPERLSGWLRGNWVIGNWVIDSFENNSRRDAGLKITRAETQGRRGFFIDGVELLFMLSPHKMKKIFLFVLVALLLFWPVKGVVAHAELRAAVPAPGASLSEQPEEIRLMFSEAVGPGSTITLFGEGFREIGGLTAEVDPERPEVLVTAVPELEAGNYSVQWMVLSLDGHPASGSYSFAVSAEAEGGFPVVVWGGVVVAAVVVLGVGAWVVRRRSFR
jgi:methionine-rich copper-binding protein CopC